MPFAWASTTSTPQTQTITISVNEVISLTVASGTIPLSSLTPGSPVFAVTSSTVLTNATSGWDLYVSRNYATDTLQNIQYPTVFFPDATSWNPFGAGNALAQPEKILASTSIPPRVPVLLPHLVGSDRCFGHGPLCRFPGLLDPADHRKHEHVPYDAGDGWPHDTR